MKNRCKSTRNMLYNILFQQLFALISLIFAIFCYFSVNFTSVHTFSWQKYYLKAKMNEFY